AGVFGARIRQPGRLLAIARGARPLQDPVLHEPQRRRVAALPRDRGSHAGPRLDLREPRLLQHPLHHHLLRGAGIPVLPPLPRDLRPADGPRAARPVGARGFQHRAHPRHRRRGRLSVSDGLEDRRPAVAHQGPLGAAGLHSLHLGAERRPAHAASLRGRRLRQDLPSPVRPAVPRGREQRTVDVHRVPSVRHGPPAPGQVPGRGARLRALPRRRVAGHHRRDRRPLSGELRRRGRGSRGRPQRVRRSPMPADRDYVLPQLRQGMDHAHYDWLPLNADRPLLEWPERARVALCVIVSLEHMEWSRPPGAYQVPNLAGGYGQGPFPDVTAWSHREYGHRVGIFRVLEALDAHGITPTIAMDALTAEHYPFLVRHLTKRGDEIIGHGVSVNRMITSRMSEDEEREYIRASVDSLTRAFGTAPRGWLGPEYGESTRTPGLLA